ncbi:Uncharacterised protein [Serratia fonticola]|uniref:Uncharacterized protein n=1 Tax=Serratia fonticola TaxID=47917 RepID=A0A4U9UJU1_SERFO|nr:Uncharacterised protein [Serratia fonticola]
MKNLNPLVCHSLRQTFTTPTLSQVIDNKGSLQGAIAAGSETDDNTPTFLGGNGTPGNTIVFYDNG